jgi:hypothetical protein
MIDLVWLNVFSLFSFYGAQSSINKLSLRVSAVLATRMRYVAGMMPIPAMASLGTS